MVAKRAAVGLVNAELPQGDRPTSVPDRESTAPHWHGSATAQIQQRDETISRLTQENRALRVAVAQFEAAAVAMQNVMRRDVEPALERGRKEMGG